MTMTGYFRINGLILEFRSYVEPDGLTFIISAFQPGLGDIDAKRAEGAVPIDADTRGRANLAGIVKIGNCRIGLKDCTKIGKDGTAHAELLRQSQRKINLDRTE